MKKRVVETCEMCSSETNNPVTIKVEGALLRVCHRCTHFGNIVEEPRSKSTPLRKNSIPGQSTRRGSITSRSKIRKSGPKMGEKELIADYANVIKNARMKKKLNQEQLAAKSGLSVPFIKSIESQKIRPTDSAAKKLERELDIELFIDPETELEFYQKSASKGTTLGDIAVIKRFEYD